MQYTSNFVGGWHIPYKLQLGVYMYGLTQHLFFTYCLDMWKPFSGSCEIGKLVMQLILDHSLKWWAGDYFEVVAIMQSEDVIMQ